MEIHVLVTTKDRDMNLTVPTIEHDLVSMTFFVSILFMNYAATSTVQMT